MQHVLIHLPEGVSPRSTLDYLLALGGRIIFPSHEYGTRACYAEEDGPTRQLSYRGPARRRATVSWGRERVQQVIDGDEPVPHGLDPETVAAARRIARRLHR